MAAGDCGRGVGVLRGGAETGSVIVAVLAQRGGVRNVEDRQVVHARFGRVAVAGGRGKVPMALRGGSGGRGRDGE